MGGRSWTFGDVSRLTNPQIAILASEGINPRNQDPRTEAEFLAMLARAAEQTGIDLDG